MDQVVAGVAVNLFVAVAAEIVSAGAGLRISKPVILSSRSRRPGQSWCQGACRWRKRRLNRGRAYRQFVAPSLPAARAVDVAATGRAALASLHFVHVVTAGEDVVALSRPVYRRRCRTGHRCRLRQRARRRPRRHGWCRGWHRHRRKTRLHRQTARRPCRRHEGNRCPRHQRSCRCQVTEETIISLAARDPVVAIPPKITSWLPAETMSSPEPATMWSSPSPPLIVCCRLDPSMLSSQAPPSMSSAHSVPTSASAPSVPMIGGYSPQKNRRAG